MTRRWQLLVVAHVVGSLLLDRWIAPTVVIAISFAIAGWLWVLAKANRRGPLSVRVKAALLVVWLFPLALFWGGFVWSLLFPTQPNIVPVDQ